MEQTENTQTPISPVNNVQNPHFSAKKLMVGICLILGLATVFVLGMGYKSKNNRVGIIEKKPVKTVETATNDMSGWKTYTDEIVGVSIQYPSDWVLENKGQTFEQGDAFRLKIWGDIQKSGTEMYDGAFLTIALPIKIEQDIEIWLRDYYTKHRVDSSAKLEFSKEILNGVEYEKVYTCGLGCFTYYNTMHNGLLYSISTSSAGANEGFYQKTLDQILSTFKFVEKQTYDTSLTYDNTSIVILNPSLNRYEDTNKQPKKYNFKYPSKDVLSVDMILDSYSEVSGISINLSNGVSLTLKPSYEGVGVDYRDKKPDVKTIVNTNFPEKLSRILNQYTQTSFTYVSNYGEGGDCSQWSPLPLACHMSGVFLDKIGGFGIVCNTSDTTKVEMCDEIVKYLDISVEETQ